MAKTGPSKERRLYDALWAISQYHKPDRLRKISESEYGCDGDQAIEMAYENVLEEAKLGIKGMRRPKD